MRKLFRITKKLLLWLFIIHIAYTLYCWVLPPPITFTMMGSLLRGEGLKKDYVSLNKINPQMRLSVIASEDQLFATHHGFDFKAIEDAIEESEKGKRRRGGSTISQQVAKNLFLWQGGGWFRKGLEVYCTFWIELLYSKRRILELYLNIAEMGKGIYGAEAAARHYFKKPASKLTAAEAAQIASVLPSPRRYTINPMSRYVSRRYSSVMRQMRNLQSDPDIKKLLQ